MLRRSSRFGCGLVGLGLLAAGCGGVPVGEVDAPRKAEVAPEVTVAPRDDASRVALTRAIRARAGIRTPEFYQDEDLILPLLEKCPRPLQPDCVCFTYWYDEDTASQYDKTFRLEGEARWDGESWELTRIVATHIGVAAHFEMSR